MSISVRHAGAVVLMAILFHAVVRSAEEQMAPPQGPMPIEKAAKRFDAVARVSQIKSRDVEGRVSTFLDAGAREFRVAYDAKGRAASVLATRGEHISDVLAIGYDEQGRLNGAVLRSGYALNIHYLPDGTQIIRDRYGGLLARRGAVALQSTDSDGRLTSAMRGLDALMSVQ
jgi:YD repeat-containing protein